MAGTGGGASGFEYADESNTKVEVGEIANAPDGDSAPVGSVAAAADKRRLLRVSFVGGVGRKKSRADAGRGTEGLGVVCDLEEGSGAAGDEPNPVFPGDL